MVTMVGEKNRGDIVVAMMRVGGSLSHHHTPFTTTLSHIHNCFIPPVCVCVAFGTSVKGIGTRVEAALQLPSGPHLDFISFSAHPWPRILAAWDSSRLALRAAL